MNKTTARFLLIILILAIAALACVGGGGAGDLINGADSSTSGNQGATVSAHATATYGAQQFQIQLTAMSQAESQAP